MLSLETKYFIEAGRDTPGRHQQTGHHVWNFKILSKKYQVFLPSNSSNILLKYINILIKLKFSIFEQKMTLIGKLKINHTFLNIKVS